MSVTYDATTQNSRMSSSLTRIDNNASAAKLEIGTAAMATVLVSITLSKPSFSLTTNVLTMLGVPKSGSASNTGTAAAARIRDGGNSDIITGLTVGTSGSDINLNSTSITSGQTVTITAFTITHS
jgi:hypothetical protein